MQACSVTIEQFRNNTLAVPVPSKVPHGKRSNFPVFYQRPEVHVILPGAHHGPHCIAHGYGKRPTRGLVTLSRAVAPTIPPSCASGDETSCMDEAWSGDNNTSSCGSNASVMLRFKVHYESRPGEDLIVTGSTPSLGSWEPEAAPRMRWTDGHVWESEETVLVEPGEVVQYKYVVVCEDGTCSAHWCQGQNLCVSVPNDGNNWVVLDSWDPHSCQVVQVGVLQPGTTEACTAECSLHSSYPYPIPFKCFLCGHCSQPHLHSDHCPLGYDDVEVQPVSTAPGTQHQPDLQNHLHGTSQETMMCPECHKKLVPASFEDSGPAE